MVAASALSGKISGPGVYKAPENLNGIEFGYGVGLPASPLGGLESIVEQLDSLIDRVESLQGDGDGTGKEAIQMLPGFPKSISGEILFCDADNLDVRPPPREFFPCGLSF